MFNAALILFIEAMLMYFLVLGAHALRHRFGKAYFYALLGGTTAIMSWVTDTGARVTVAGVTFVVGSTVFYTALLLGVFVVYVFDGPRHARIAISTVMGLSIMMPVIAAVLHVQAGRLGNAALSTIPQPSLRINAASVATTLIDLLFLGIAWEFLGKPVFRMKLWLRTYLTLLGVMWLDVFLFSTGAFAGTGQHLSIMQGTLVSRFVISVFSFPILYAYLSWQKDRAEMEISNRPVLSILQRMTEMKEELSLAQREIERRKQAEQERDRLIRKLRKSREQFRELSQKYRRASTTDELTGVPNRRYFNEALEREWGRSARANQPLSLLLMDVDDFKEYNDEHGHVAGDRLLEVIAQALSQVPQRPGDIFARFGGDEFVMILPKTDREGALTVAQKALEEMQEVEVPRGDIEVGDLTISIGAVSAIPHPESPSEEMVRLADQALFQAKENGRDGVVFSSWRPETK